MPGIRHVVPVILNYEEGDPRVKEFFDKAKEMLGSIPEAIEYHHYKQTNPNSPYTHGFVLEFKSEEDYQKYLEHPQAEEYTEKYWNPGLKECLDFNFEEFD